METLFNDMVYIFTTFVVVCTVLQEIYKCISDKSQIRLLILLAHLNDNVSISDTHSPLYNVDTVHSHLFWFYANKIDTPAKQEKVWSILFQNNLKHFLSEYIQEYV